MLLAGAAPAVAPDLVRPQTVTEMLDRLEAAFKARAVLEVLNLYAPLTEEARREETEALDAAFSAEEVQLSLQPPTRVPSDITRVRLGAQVFSTREPRARVDQWRYVLERRDGAWMIASREDLGEIDGLVHLSMDPTGFRADGLVLKLEDFELRFRSGTLFTSPASLGPTLLVFVGEGEVMLSPTPPAEREQLRRFAGGPELRERVKNAFVRLHPADLHRLLQPAELVPDPRAAERLPAAQRVYREQAHRYFILDATLPRSPWWLLPGVGDASVTFETRRRGELTFAVSSSEAEDLSLFARARRRQICLYTSGGRQPRYSEDDGRALDLLHLDLTARFEPARRFLSAEATLKMKMLLPTSTARLRLDDDFRVESVTSAEGGQHLFFRVRGQNSLMVSLGALAGARQEVTLTIRYSGTHEPEPVDDEVIQGVGRSVEVSPFPEGGSVEGVLVYTNRTSWYPRPQLDDHAITRLRFDVPVGLSAVTGGERVLARVEGLRTLVEYRQDRPAKYVTAAVGRFQEAGTLETAGLRLRAFGLARTREEAGALLQRSARILSFFAARFGPCPYPDLDLLLIEGEAPGGHAPPGMVLLQRRPPLLRRALRDDPASFPDEPDFFLAHEIAHQWFGQGVSGANYRERWLSEGFAQYAAALWVRESGGERRFRDVLDRFARWAIRYDDEGPIHIGYRVGHLRGDAQAYRAVVYDKAAYVLHMLRGVTGDLAFFRGLRAYQEAHLYGKAGTDDLREALEAASAKDLRPHFQAWVLGTGIARLTYRWSRGEAGGAFRVEVHVEADGLPGAVPLQVTVVHAAGEVSRTVEIKAKGAQITVEAPGRPRRVDLNADRGLLAVVSKS